MGRIQSTIIKSSAAMLAVAIAVPAGASAQNNPELNSYRIETNDCPGCGAQQFTSQEDVRAYLNDFRAILADGRGNSSSSNSYYNPFSRSRSNDQVVFLDFDAGGAPTFPVCNSDGSVFGIFQDHFYTQPERDAIQARIAADYGDFDFSFTQTQPNSGEFTTLVIGQNDAPLDCSGGSNITVTATGGVSILFGQADAIDFRNQNMSDNAFADASIWEFLAQLDPSGGFFEAFSGLSVDDFGGNLLLAVSEAVTNQTANTGAHEVGHLQGLRHQNSFGAPGDGIPDTGAISPFDFVPVFDGPSNASETVLHTMASGASVGLGLSGSTITDRFFSERSAARLTIAERGRVTSESSARRWRGFVSLGFLSVPNTIVEGRNQNSRISVRANVIEGDIDVLDETDSYTFFGIKGEFFNAELVSVIGEGLSFDDGILGQVRLYQINRNGSETLIASNLQSFESLFDAEIFDVELPAYGFYRVEVSAPDEFFPFDADGDGALDPQTISTFGGAPQLLTGSYSLQMFTCSKRLQPGRRVASN